MAAGDGRPRSGGGLAGRGGPGPVPPSPGALEGDRDGSRHRPGGPRHGCGAGVTALLVIAKAPVPGRVKTRLSPPCTPEQAATLAAAALRDTLEAAAASRRARRLVLALDGSAPSWLPPGIEVIPQRGPG